MAIEAAHVYQGRGGEESAAHAGRSEKFPEFVVGQVVDGRVKRIMDYGVFVDLDGIDGLVPIREVSWDPVKNIREHCHEGDVVRVVVLSLDSAKLRISLSIRRLTERPKPVEREMASAVDKAELKARDAMIKSREMMYGHKAQLCGYSILLGLLAFAAVIFTLGIGLIWFVPFAQTFMANYYLQVKTQYELTHPAVVAAE